MLWLYLFTVALSLRSAPSSIHLIFFLYWIPSSLPLCAPLPLRLILYIQKYMQSIFMPFHQTSLISLRLNPQPDNAWRRPVLYRSIRLSSSLQGKWSVGNVMYMAQGLRKHSVFRQPYLCPRLWGSLQLHTFMQTAEYINSTCTSGGPVGRVPVSTK